MAARALSALHSLADDREADIARRRGCGECLRDGLQLARLLLRSAPLGLLHREPGLVGEPPHHRDHGWSRLRDLALPLQRKDPLELGSDHDRDAKRGVEAKALGVPQRLTTRLQLGVRDEHRPERAHLLDQAREVGEVDPPAGRDHVARRVAPGDLELLVVDRRPDLHHVAAEGSAGLGADRHDDGLERRALLEARRHGEHAIERLARAPLELVQPGALECLTAEIGRDAGEGPHLGRDRVRLLERKSHRPGEPLADEDRHRERARGIWRERRSLAEPRDELGPPLHPRGLTLAGSRRDRRPGRERKAGARAERLSPRPARVDDHELLALDEPERSASRADRVRHALHHHAGHFLHGQRRRK